MTFADVCLAVAFRVGVPVGDHVVRGRCLPDGIERVMSWTATASRSKP